MVSYGAYIRTQDIFNRSFVTVIENDAVVHRCLFSVNMR